MLHLAFTSQIYRLKTLLTAFIVSLFLAFVLTDFKGPSIGLSNSTNKAIVDQLSWSDFYDLCIEEPWTMRLEQQMQCNRLVSDVFSSFRILKKGIFFYDKNKSMHYDRKILKNRLTQFNTVLSTLL